MRTRMVASLLGLALFLASIPAAHAETINTNTNTEISPENISFDFNNSSLSLDVYGKNSLTVHRNVQVLADAAYTKKMSSWKTKQAALWERLPTESFTVNASAYTAAADECGKSNGITASGVKVQEHRTLACPANLPFGTKIEIEGMGTYTCEDRGGAIVGNHVDIYMPTKAEAFAFGRRNLDARIVQ